MAEPGAPVRAPPKEKLGLLGSIVVAMVGVERMAQIWFVTSLQWFETLHNRSPGAIAVLVVSGLVGMGCVYLISAYLNRRWVKMASVPPTEQNDDDAQRDIEHRLKWAIMRSVVIGLVGLGLALNATSIWTAGFAACLCLLFRLSSPYVTTTLLQRWTPLVLVRRIHALRAANLIGATVGVLGSALSVRMNSPTESTRALIALLMACNLMAAFGVFLYVLCELKQTTALHAVHAHRDQSVIIATEIIFPKHTPPMDAASLDHLRELIGRRCRAAVIRTLGSAMLCQFSLLWIAQKITIDPVPILSIGFAVLMLLQLQSMICGRCQPRFYVTQTHSMPPSYVRRCAFEFAIVLGTGLPVLLLPASDSVVLLMIGLIVAVSHVAFYLGNYIVDTIRVGVDVRDLSIVTLSASSVTNATVRNKQSALWCDIFVLLEAAELLVCIIFAAVVPFSRLALVIIFLSMSFIVVGTELWTSRIHTRLTIQNNTYTSVQLNHRGERNFPTLPQGFNTTTMWNARGDHIRYRCWCCAHEDTRQEDLAVLTNPLSGSPPSSSSSDQGIPSSIVESEPPSAAAVATSSPPLSGFPPPTEPVDHELLARLSAKSISGAGEPAFQITVTEPSAPLRDSLTHPTEQ